MPLDAFTPDARKMIDRVESELHEIARMSMCRDDAIHIKERLARPIGILGSKNHIPSEREAKRRAYQIGMNTVRSDE